MIAVPGDLFENHEFGENLDKEDDSLISRLLCRIIHLANRLAGLRWRQKHRCCKQNAYDFLMKASEIAPVVMSLGNHELYLTEEDKAVLASANVALLNNSTVEIKSILFGGIPSKQITGKIDTEFLRSFSDLPGYKVLLCHHPEYYCQLRSYRDAIQEVTQCENAIHELGLSKEAKKTIDRYVSAVGHRWVLCGDYLYKSGMRDILLLLENR